MVRKTNRRPPVHHVNPSIAGSEPPPPPPKGEGERIILDSILPPSRNKEDILNIKQEILRLEKAKTSTVDFFREYTKAFIKILSTLSVLDSDAKQRNVKVFYANPERAIAKLMEDRNIVLPVVSVMLDDIDEDISRRRNYTNLEISTTWDEKTQRAVRVVSLAPKPLSLTISINFFAKYTEDINQLTEQVQLMFNPSLPVVTKFSEVTHAFISEVSDNSSLVLDDKQDRVLKKVILVTVAAYIPPKKYLITSTGELEVFNTEVIVD